MKGSHRSRPWPFRPSPRRQLVLVVTVWAGVAAIALSGCTLSVASTPFLTQGANLSSGGKLPFHGTWVGDEQKLIEAAKSVNKIVIRDVSIEYAAKRIDQMDWPERIKTYRKEELAEIARYMKERFQSAILENASHPMEITAQSGPGTLELELALVEVIPTNAFASVLSTAGGFLLPGTGILTAFAQGTVAMEGRLRNAETGDVLFEFKDRASDKNAPFSVKDYREYAHIRAVIDTWAAQYGRLQGQNFEGTVPGSGYFTLNPF